MGKGEKNRATARKTLKQKGRGENGRNRLWVGARDEPKECLSGRLVLRTH